MGPTGIKLWLLLLLSITALLPPPVNPLILPPSQKLKMGLAEELRDECLSLTDSYTNHYNDDVVEGYELGSNCFTKLSEAGERPTRLFYPKYANSRGELEELADVMMMNWKSLGGIDVKVKHWPETPCSCMEVSWPFKTPELPVYSREGEGEVEVMVRDTEEYVDVTLAGLGLCPFTKSMERSALGLESMGVKPGPVAIRHSAEVGGVEGTTPAMVLAAMYWNGVRELITLPETEAATFLLLAPKGEYGDFKKFANDCDKLVEKTNFLAPGMMGRVWFHPEYKLSSVGYQSGGHAPPLTEVEGLMDKYLTDHPGATRPSKEDTIRAHDLTRYTPWPTINLLRPKQLELAKENDKRENRAKVYPRNVVRVVEAEKEEGGLKKFGIKCPFR
mmetsp:Transcript_23771/g.49540  ORF Transcript_23771/g.49540 Transcript_23771/m.49540 type:complete len:389 (+) Transcript_23771:216-1382(+)